MEARVREEIAQYKMGEDFYLIEPLKEVKVSKRLTIPDEDAEPEKDGTKPVKKVTRKVAANFQLGKVLVKPGNERAKFNVGETIIFRPRSTEDFDLVKGTKLVRFFDVIGSWLGN